MKSRYLHITDLHLNRVSLWKKLLFFRQLIKENPKGIFLTGDISTGLFLYMDLYLLATFVKCPIYFVIGNHDNFFSDLESTKTKIRKLCEKFPNLIWMTEQEVIPLKKDVALIGHEGWYDGYHGNNKYLKYTLDHIFIKDFRQLSSMKEKLQVWRQMAKDSANIIGTRLQTAIDMGYKSIHILTHYPPYREATRDMGTILESFWVPYNSNHQLGLKINEIMSHYPDIHLTIHCGHSHDGNLIQVAPNIMCIVNKNKYYGWIGNDEILYI